MTRGHRHQQPHPSPARSLRAPGLVALKALAFFAAYVLASEVGKAFIIPELGAAPLWVPTGVAVAGVWLLGRRYALVIVPGAIAGDLLRGLHLDASLFDSVGEALEAFIAVSVVRWRPLGFQRSLERVRDVAVLVLGATLGAMTCATGGMLSLLLLHDIAAADLPTGLAMWIIGDATTIILVLPLFCTLDRSWLAALRRPALDRRTLETAAIVTAMVPLGALALAYKHPEFVFPPVIWAALRYGPRGAMAANLVASVAAISFGRRLFGFSDATELINGQTFIAVTAVANLMFATVTAQLRVSKQANRALAESEARLEQAQQLGRIGWWHSEDRQVVMARDVCLALGLDPDGGPLSYPLLLAITHPDDRARLRDALIELDRDAGSIDLSLRFVRPGGHVVMMHILGEAAVDRDGLPLGFYGAAQDVTESWQRELTLLKLAAIVEQSDDAIFRLDPNGLVLAWNPAAVRLFGYTVDEAMGMPLQALIPPSHGEERLAIERALASGGPVRFNETEWLGKNGVVVPITVTVSPIRDTQAAVAGSSVIARDITDWRRAHEQRVQLERRLNQSQRLETVGPARRAGSRTTSTTCSR